MPHHDAHGFSWLPRQTGLAKKVRWKIIVGRCTFDHYNIQIIICIIYGIAFGSHKIFFMAWPRLHCGSWIGVNHELIPRPWASALMHINNSAVCLAVNSTATINTTTSPLKRLGQRPASSPCLEPKPRALASSPNLDQLKPRAQVSNINLQP